MIRSLSKRMTSGTWLWALIATTLFAQSSSGQGPFGLMAKGPIVFSGGAILDSYNSNLGPYTGIHGAAAMAITDTNSSGAISLSSGSIYGLAITGPGGTVKATGSSAVGSTNWVGYNTGVEPGWSADVANLQFPDNSAPYISSAIVPSSGQLGGTNYPYLLNSASSPYYVNGNLNVIDGQSMMIVSNVTLYVTQKLIVSGNGIIIIAPGASLNLYVGGPCTISGGGIANETGKPANCAIYGLPTCPMVTYSGATAFQGTVNAPEADYTESGGSGLFGAITASTITIITSAVHYDEALLNQGEIIFAIHPLSNGQMQLSGYGAGLTSYLIQATTNPCAGSWITLATNNIGFSGPINFVDQDSTNYPCRFYRAVAP